MSEDATANGRRAKALAASGRAYTEERLHQLEPLIRERADAIEHAVEDAAEMGREHGLAGGEPYCRLDEDGHDTQLMKAFGETEPTTDANALHRLALIRAYTTAYRDARRHADAAVVQLAERDFPPEPDGPFTRVDPLDFADPAKAGPRAQSQCPRKSL